jgi:hypothetical protein
MKRYIYICSAGHSGSTLLDLLIGSHSQVESLGEITHLPKNISLNTICMCGEPVRSCEFWGKVFDNLENKTGFDIYNDPYSLDLGFINAQVIVDRNYQTTAYNLKRKIYRGCEYLRLRYRYCTKKNKVGPSIKHIKNNISLYNSVIQANNVNCIVDSSKDYLKAVNLYIEKKEIVRLILLVRDGRGVFYSNLKRGNSRKESLRPWLNHYRRALKLIERYIPADNYLIVKYEDLSINTEQVLKRICRFVNIEYQNRMLEFLDNPHHIANGNNMRFGESSEIKLDLKWKKKLTVSDLRYFSRLAGNTNKRLGYI